MADLYGTYDQRIKLTIDHDKIDAALTWFPVTVFFTAAQGEEIFSEFDADGDYMKCAFTKDDEVTELYAEMELFDVSESKAIYHVSLDGWAISDSADTVFYYYYDNDASDNTTYIGAINTTPGAAVWDGNFKAVYHMVDATTSTVVDSTSNNNDGAKLSANNPIEAAGKVGQGQDFSTDYIIVNSTDFAFGSGSFTVEFIAKADSGTSTEVVISYQKTTVTPVWQYRAASDYVSYNDRTGEDNTDAKVFDDLAYHHIVGVKVGTDVAYFVDGESVASTVVTGSLLATLDSSDTDDLYLGRRPPTGTQYWDGIQDEIRISSTNRAAAWEKGSYNSLWDTLLTYGEEPAVVNAISFGANF